MHRVKPGLEVLVEQKLDLIRGKRVALVTNHSAVNHNLVHSIEVLKSVDANIVALFAPEHGVRGDVPAGKVVPSGTDARTGIPIHSLYGANKRPTPKMLEGVDAVLFDIQDIGCRFYTYISTMSYMMQACAQSEKQFIILDRPNPINGIAVEGNIPEKEFASFVGMHPIPIRHGMTIGELAVLFNEQFGFGAELHVVPCMGWKRAYWFDETNLFWVLPSPNMPTIDTALLYPGSCLLEGTNISEGRGTSKPFELIGAAWIDPYSLATVLNGAEMPGVRFRPTYFVPTASKFTLKQCGGVQIHITNRTDIQPVRVGITLIKIIHDMYPQQFSFLAPGKSGKQFFDLLSGTDKIREGIEAHSSVDEIMSLWYYDLGNFMELRKKYLLYS